MQASHWPCNMVNENYFDWLVMLPIIVLQNGQSPHSPPSFGLGMASVLTVSEDRHPRETCYFEPKVALICVFLLPASSCLLPFSCFLLPAFSFLLSLPLQLETFSYHRSYFHTFRPTLSFFYLRRILPLSCQWRSQSQTCAQEKKKNRFRSSLFFLYRCVSVVCMAING